MERLICYVFYCHYILIVLFPLCFQQYTNPQTTKDKPTPATSNGPNIRANTTVNGRDTTTKPLFSAKTKVWGQGVEFGIWLYVIAIIRLSIFFWKDVLSWLVIIIAGVAKGVQGGHAPTCWSESKRKQKVGDRTDSSLFSRSDGNARESIKTHFEIIAFKDSDVKKLKLSSFSILRLNKTYTIWTSKFWTC